LFLLFASLEAICSDPGQSTTLLDSQEALMAREQEEASMSEPPEWLSQ
jgi:hypothetical protein